MTSFDEMRPVAKRVFSGRDGELFLEHLKRRYYDCSIKDETALRQLGRRDVVLDIFRMLMEDHNVQK